MLSLKGFRSPAAGFPDLLNYAAVIDDGIILNKDGSLMAGFYYRPSDMDSASVLELNGISARINSVLSRFGSGWMTHHNAIRFPSKEYPDTSHFPDPITKLIDLERKCQFEAEGEHFETVYSVVVTYMPPSIMDSQITQIIFDDDSCTNKKVDWTKKLLSDFKSALLEFEDGFAFIDIERMRGVQFVDENGRSHTKDTFLQFLNFCLVGEMHPILLPPCPMYIDSIIGGYDFVGGLTPQIDGKYVGVISIDGFPHESYPGILAVLDHLSDSYRWCTRFIYMDIDEAKSHIMSYRRKWQQKVKGLRDQIFKTSHGIVDQDALSMVSDSEGAAAEASSNIVTFGYYTASIVIFNPDQDSLDESLRYVSQSIKDLGFNARIENINAIEAYLGSLPGHSVPNARRPLLHTMNLADLLPISAMWPGLDFNPCPFYPDNSPPLLHVSTNGSTPMRLNLHVGDVGHACIFGPTGSGKSTLLALIIAQFMRYQDATVFAFDKGYSLLPLTLAIGGYHYDILADKSTLNFSPLAGVNSDATQMWAEGWIEALLELQGVQLTPKLRKTIHTAMSIVRESEHTETLTDFSSHIQNTDLRDALRPFTVSGSLGHLLDTEGDSLNFGSLQTFEIETLMNMGDKYLVPVLLYLFHRIDQCLKGQPALLVLDEAWIMLGHSVFREKIREWLKVKRKENCAVVLATQSLSDAASSGILDVLGESCLTKIYLPNSTAKDEQSRKYYEMLGLNDRQINIISDSIPKREYYYVSPLGKRLFDLNLGPIALSFVGASGKKDIAEIKRLNKTVGNEWPYEWLKSREVDYENYCN